MSKDIDISLSKLLEVLPETVAMLKRFASKGEQLWDDLDFRDGYKKISSGDLIDCRNLLRKLGISDFDD